MLLDRLGLGAVGHHWGTRSGRLIYLNSGDKAGLGVGIARGHRKGWPYGGTAMRVEYPLRISADRQVDVGAGIAVQRQGPGPVASRGAPGRGRDAEAG